jgi:O-methyltransferase
MSEAATLYVDLLARVLSGELSRERVVQRPVEPPANRLLRRGYEMLRGSGVQLTTPVRVPPSAWEEGRDWPKPYPAWLDTMLGRRRLDNVRHCVEDVLQRGVAGDLIEAGVWRGGSTILMRGILAAHGDRERRVVVADSFQGLPPPDVERYPDDGGFTLHEEAELAVSVDDVRANFDRFGLLDERVEFVQGFFRDTLPALRGRRWAVIRLDGDMYESTMDGLENLYDGLSIGGWLIVDDYGAYAACRKAVEDFRERRGITEVIRHVDWSGAYWRREG